MKSYFRFYKSAAALMVVLLLMSGGYAQKKKKAAAATQLTGKAVMWESVNVSAQDLFNGTGGDAMKPDLSKIEFIKKEKGGHNKKYRIKDGSGRVWVAKPFTEARPETAAVRILSGLGYKNEINYLVPELTIPGVGSFKNVRLEARPDRIERLDEWRWKRNPFSGTNEFQGLKIMQVFLNNNDVIDINNKILKVNGRNGPELQYIVSDLGSTFGKFGSNNFPIIYRFGRKNDLPQKWNKAPFIKGVKNGRIVFATKGTKSRGLFKDITVSQGRWLLGLLTQLDERQMRDAFKAANYSSSEIELLVSGTKRRINELANATSGDRLAEN